MKKKELNKSKFNNLFYTCPFSYKMGISKGNLKDFFASHEDDDDRRTNLRKIFLSRSENRYCGILPEGEGALSEFNELLQSWNLTKTNLSVKDIGRTIVPDFMFMKDGVLVGGCVCFPSSWSFEEKLGKSLDWIHGPVPTLNKELGGKICNFMSKLKDGQAWLRNNWGLTASNSLNYHPSNTMPKLTKETEPNNIWFRVENQLISKLPKSKSALFAIRLKIHSLNEVKKDLIGRKGLFEALETMPDSIAEYKNILKAKDSITEWLKV